VSFWDGKTGGILQLDGEQMDFSGELKAELMQNLQIPQTLLKHLQF